MKGMRALRELLARRIDENGGYNRNYGAAFALSWSVPVYGIGPVDIVQELVKQGEFISGADILLRFPDVQQIWENWLDGSHSYANEQLFEDLQDGVRGDDGYRMWSPEIARKYGFSYTGLGAEETFDATFEFHGRGGKHLCVVAFQGVKLESYGGVTMPQQIDHRDQGEQYRYSNLWCRQLLAMMEEWDRCFTQEAAQEEARYRCAWRFAQWLMDEYVEGEDEAEDEAA